MNRNKKNEGKVAVWEDNGDCAEGKETNSPRQFIFISI